MGIVEIAPDGAATLYAVNTYNDETTARDYAEAIYTV